MVTIKRFGMSEYGINPDYNNEIIPVFIELESITPHRISTEFFGMKRYGFGTGLGVDYSNINVNGLAERLNINLNSSFEFCLNKRTSSYCLTIGVTYVLRCKLVIPIDSGWETISRVVESKLIGSDESRLYPQTSNNGGVGCGFQR